MWVNRHEISAIAKFLKLQVANFAKEYLRQVGRRTSLIEKANHDCIFWDRGCTIYPVRPTQCRTFPFWREHVRRHESWRELSRECPGVHQGRHYSAAEIECLKRGQGETKDGVLKQPLKGKGM